jgi:hypothetical protein
MGTLKNVLKYKGYPHMIDIVDMAIQVGGAREGLSFVLFGRFCLEPGIWLTDYWNT